MAPPPADVRERLRPGSGHAAFPSPDVAGSLVAHFAAVATRHPDRPAVIDSGGQLTYAELEAESARLASAIADAEASGSCVALLLPQGRQFVTAFVAAIRTGATVVPLDPTHPDGVLSALLEHACAGVVVADAATAVTALRVGRGRPVVDVAAPPGPRWIDPTIGGDRPATLFYTSGSTGAPKGVLDSHANILDNVGRYVNALGIGSGDRLSLVHGPMFSGLASSLFGALLTGAAVVPIDLRATGLHEAATRLRQAEATMLHLVPSVYRRLLDTTERWPSVRVVRLEGDAATWRDAARGQGRFAVDALVVNGLGTTESGLVAQLFVDPRSAGTLDGPLPVGYLVPGIAVRIVDETGDDRRHGEVGDLIVYGERLALEYWRDPERTAERFIEFDDSTVRGYRTGDVARVDDLGRLLVLGRRDHVRKVRGQSIDPTLVETRLLDLEGVTGAAVITREDLDVDDVRLVAYAATTADLDPVEIRQSLANVLPVSHVPSAIVVLPALPLTAAGKVDTAALPAPGRARPALAAPYVSPRDQLEEAICGVWARMLDVRPVGIHDEFFDLGGDSLAAMSMLLDVERAVGRSLPVAVLARGGTVADLAAAIRDARERSDGEIVQLSSGTGPSIFLIHADGGNPLFYRSIARALGSDATVYSIQPPDLQAKSAYESIAAKAERYAQGIVAIQPDGPYHIVGHCFGGAVAHEVGRTLVRRGHVVATLTLLGIGPLEFPTLVAGAAKRRYWRSRWRHRIRSVVREVSAAGILTAGRRTARLAVGLAGRRIAVIAARIGRPLPASRGRTVLAFPEMTALAVETHRAAPFPGRLRVVVGRDATPRYLGDPGSDLAGLATGPVVVVMLPGDDHAMLAPPVSNTVGALLRGWVDEIGGSARPDA